MKRPAVETFAAAAAARERTNRVGRATLAALRWRRRHLAAIAPLTNARRFTHPDR